MECRNKEIHGIWKVIMMKYLHILRGIIRINFAKTLIFKGHFYMETVNSIGWGALSVVTILILTTHIQEVFGWTRSELILLAVMVNIVYGILRVVFDINFWALSEIVNTGELDQVLLKPVDSQLHMSIWRIDFGGILRILIAIGLTIYLLVAFDFSVTPMSVILAILLCILGVSMLYSITFIFLTITIWYSNLYNLMHLINGVLGVSRYPKEMYANLTSVIFFFLLPIVLIISTPTKALVQKGDLFDSLLLITFAIIFFTISRFFWKFALRYYTSAN